MSMSVVFVSSFDCEFHEYEPPLHISFVHIRHVTNKMDIEMIRFKLSKMIKYLDFT